MTDKDIERRLADALAKSAPDDVEDVMSRCRNSGCRESKGTVVSLNITEKNINAKTGQTGIVTVNKNNAKKRRIWRNVAAACLALMIVGGGGVYAHQSYSVASVVSLDVNPSIELKVNSREKVLSCEAMNDEGRDVLADMSGGKDLKGAKLDVAVNAIVGGLVKNGYFDSISSAILISVEDSDITRAERLQKQLCNAVNSVLSDNSHTADVLSQTLAQNSALDEKAKSNNISTGKAALINQIINMNSALKFDSLSGLSIEELKDLREMGAPGMPIGRDAAAKAARDYSGASSIEDLTSSSVHISTEVDPELDDEIPHYEVEIKHSVLGEFEYKVDAYSGKVISGSKGVFSASKKTAVSESSGSATGASAPTSNTKSSGAASNDIGESRARSIAMNHAGVTSSDVHSLESECDREDGRLVYEIEFKAGGMEYDYVIDAASGSVIKHESEHDD